MNKRFSSGWKKGFVTCVGMGAGLGLLGGCGKAVPDLVTLTFRFAGQNSASAASSFRLDRALGFEDPVSRMSNAALTGLPAAVTDFTCLGVNITGSGIPASGKRNDPGFNADKAFQQMLSGDTCATYPGITSGPILTTQDTVLSLTAPAGPKRIIQVVGILDQGSGICSGTAPIADPSRDKDGSSTIPGAGATGSGGKEQIYELGRSVSDLFRSQQVVVNNAYGALTTDDDRAKRNVSCHIGGDVQINFPPNNANTYPVGATFHPVVSFRSPITGQVTVAIRDGSCTSGNWGTEVGTLTLGQRTSPMSVAGETTLDYGDSTFAGPPGSYIFTVSYVNAAGQGLGGCTPINFGVASHVKASDFLIKVASASNPTAYVDCGAGKYAVFGGGKCAAGSMQESCSSSDGTACINTIGEFWRIRCPAVTSQTDYVWAVCANDPSPFTTVQFSGASQTVDCGVGKVALGASLACPTPSGTATIATSCGWNGTVCATNQQFWKSTCEYSGALPPMANSFAVCVASGTGYGKANNFGTIQQTLANPASPTCGAGAHAIMASPVCGATTSLVNSCPSSGGACVSTSSTWNGEWSLNCSSGASVGTTLVCVPDA